MLFGCSGLLIAAAAFITEIPPQVRSALVCSEDTSGVFVQEKRMCGKDGVLSEKKFTTEGRYRIRPGVDFVWETEKPFKSRFYATTEKYVYSDEQLQAYLRELGEGAKPDIQRYKGLGEMSAEQLWETTMNPATRTMMQITPEDAMAADEIFTLLMGDQVEPRRDFIIANSKLVTYLDV